jgi:hypothetical protein
LNINHAIRATIENNTQVSFNSLIDREKLINELTAVLSGKVIPEASGRLPFIVVIKDDDSKELVCVIAAKSVKEANELISFEEMDEVFGLEKGQLQAFEPTDLHKSYLVDGKSFETLASETYRNQRVFDVDDIDYELILTNFISREQQ